MTVLEDSIRIKASPKKVWSVLSTLDALEKYDPGVARSLILEGATQGVGASRQCYLAPGGWFRERVTVWTPESALAFELYECTLPVKALRHSYSLRTEGQDTLVLQRMEYELKFGLLGKAMDAIMIRKKWKQGIRAFLVGLKRHIEEIAP